MDDRILRILAVDDEEGARLVLRRALEQAGYLVTVADSAEAALELIRTRGLPDAVVSDIRLPGASGIELCRALQAFSDVPCLLVSVIDDEESIAQAIEEVAEDYLVKPIRPAELRARLGRVLRRVGGASATEEPWQRIDEGLALSFVAQRARLAERTVELTPTETKLLHLLWRSAPEPLSMEHLRRRLMVRERISEEAVRVHLHRLRRKLELDPANPRRLLTRPGRGYCLARDVGARAG